MNTTLTINWKGTASTAIAGLMISELPPITKPEMRTDRTEIDGRPGDIADELGYSAYKKRVKIALTTGYDVDAIAKYFTGSGYLTLSDEPTKKYKARIEEAVDFEKLLRFKTADVNFIVQPYKYLATESDVTLNITTETDVDVTNAGLEESKPLIRLEGTGIVEITIDTVPIFSVDIDDSYVLIDSEAMDAYITGELKNHMMTGDFPTLQPGVNTIGWTGTLTKIVVTPRSRWL
jgi:phage-related protein